MALRDCLGTLNTIAQAHGRAWLAGTFDAFLDLASILVTVTGAGPVLLHGVTAMSIVTIGCMMVTSFFGTALWTRVGDRMTEEVVIAGPAT